MDKDKHCAVRHVCHLCPTVCAGPFTGASTGNSARTKTTTQIRASTVALSFALVVGFRGEHVNWLLLLPPWKKEKSVLVIMERE